VARPAVSIAVSTTERHLERSCARRHAELRPRLAGRRSDSTARSQARRGRPPRRRQPAGRRPPEGHGNDPATDQPARHVRTDATAPTRRQRRPPSPAPHPQHGPRMEHATHGASTTDQRHPDADQRPPPHSTRPRHTRESGAYRHRKVGPRWVLLYRSRWHSVC